MKIPASAKYGIIEQMMQREDNMLNIKWLCETAGVSRSGYYHYLQTAELREQREQKDRTDFELILIAYNHRGYSKGARGVYMRFLHMDLLDVHMNIKKIRRLMKKYGLFCPVRKANPYRRIAQNRFRSRQPSESRVRGARPESHIADRHNIYHQWQGTALLYVNNNRCLHKGTAGLGIK